ncbi:hypothetical protein FPHYL_2858 [Fusarium phyllophilum]|uniref:Uncharacterized protein n=1 Tax=Fusarium phyllophilum TaxID=47803 RepID=A0A8H5K5V8_9HYPO|nr:hypothetical protein FPHYL_2858 [Fusarium phyllophilum]
MQIYHEPTPWYRVNADRWRNQNAPTQQKLSTCIGAARVLQKILEDLVDELRRYTNTAARTAQDAAYLITIVSYLYYEPLLNVRTALERHSVPNRLRYLRRIYIRALDKLYTCLHHALEFAQRTLGEHPATTRMTQQYYEFSISQNDEPFKIPAFSPLELLLRVVTARERWVSHAIAEALFEAYRRLKVRRAKPPGDCLPKAGFACLGMETNRQPTCVLAFSADYWEGYKEMHSFVKDLHESRRHAFDGIQLRNIVMWSDTLCVRYDQKETPLSLIANPPGYFTHEDDVASPFYCNTFKPRDRCTRYQALFKYKVTEVVRNLEAVMNRKNERREPNKNWSCAEVYAHFFCQQLSEDGHSPCEMH